MHSTEEVNQILSFPWSPPFSATTRGIKLSVNKDSRAKKKPLKVLHMPLFGCHTSAASAFHWGSSHSFSELQTSAASFQALPSPGAWSEGKEWKFKPNSKQNQALLCVHTHTCLEVPQLILLPVFCSIWNYCVGFFFFFFLSFHASVRRKTKEQGKKIYIFLEKKKLLYKECFVLCRGPAQLSNSRFNRWGRLVTPPSRLIRWLIGNHLNHWIWSEQQ